MALVSRTIPVKLGKLDSKTDSRFLLAGDLVASANLAFDNWPKLRKRNGFAQLNAAPAGARLATYKSQLLLGTGAEAFSQAASGLIDKGVLEDITVSALPVRRDAYVETVPDSAVHPAGISVYTWESSVGFGQYSVFDTATGQPIVAGVSLGNVVRIKALAIGSYVVIFYFDNGSSHLKFIAIPVATPSAPTAPVDFATDIAGTHIYDATAVGGLSGQIVVVYQNNGGSNKITLKPLSPRLVVGAALVPTTAEAINTCCSIFADSSQNIWVAYYTGSAVKAFVYDYALANQLMGFTSLDGSPGTVRNITGIVPPGTNNTATILYEAVGSQTYNNFINWLTVSFGLPPAITSLTVGAGTLGSGTYFYRVTALNGPGQTLPSKEVSITIVGPAGVNINWNAVPGAGGYELYGRSTGAELGMGTIFALTALDNGSVTPSGAMPTSNTFTNINGPSVLVRSVGLASKPFVYLGRVHVLAAYQSALQTTYFLLSVSSAGVATVVAKLAPSLGGGLTARAGILPEVPNPSTGVYSTVYLQTTEIGVQAGSIFSQTGVMAGTFDFTQPQTSVELSDDLHLAGGILSMYDGNGVCEHGFHLYPENLAFTSTTGGNCSAGSYQAFAVYEWMDAMGLIHQSAPSPVQTLSGVAANSAFNYTVQSLRLTSKGTPVNVVFYRTTVNSQTFFRVTPIATPNVNTTVADTVSAPTSSTGFDTLSDLSLAGNAQPYTNPENALAEVPNLSAPAMLHVWRYRNRVVGIPAENPFQWIYSKAFVAGVPVEFNNQQLYQSVDQEGGALACGIEMDDKNILFSPMRIRYVTGDGPAANGTGSDYAASPQGIPSDVGCANRRSLLLTPFGVMFQAANGKGIYLLGRDLSVSYIGAPVEAFNGLTITAAKLSPNNRRALFFTSGGVALVFDFFAEKWSVWTNVSAADAAVFNGLLAYVKTGGQLWQETPGQFTDNGAPILIGFQLGILSFAGLSGFQRVWKFGIRGDYRSAHYLSVSVAYDDSPAPLQTQVVSSSVLNPGAVSDTTLGDTDNPGGGSYPAAEWVVKCAKQLCSSIQVTVQESQAGPTYGEGLSISGLAFVVGTLPRLHPVGKSRSI